jgi:hypothetical protein
MSQPAPTAKTVFDHAHELASPAERQAYLDQACAGAPGLRAQVEALLRAHDEAGSFLQKPAVAPPAAGPVLGSNDTPRPLPHGLPDTTDDASTATYFAGGESPGAWIGPYRLVKLLG